MIVAGGIVSLKPVGPLISNRPLTQQQVDAAQAAQAQKEAQINSMVDKLAAQRNAQPPTPEPEKRWSVPFK